MLETRNFLLPDATFAIEMVAFLVVLVVMSRYVVPRIRERMQQRVRVIEDSLAAARAADHRRQEAESAATAIRADARREARHIVDEARSHRDILIAEGRKSGTEEYRWRAGRAERELRRRTELAHHMARAQARKAAIAAVRAQLGPDIEAAQIVALVDEHLPARSASSRSGHTVAWPMPSAAREDPKSEGRDVDRVDRRG
jgi:F-type H+-transporting ATPase subunit b